MPSYQHLSNVLFSILFSFAKCNYQILEYLIKCSISHVPLCGLPAYYYENDNFGIHIDDIILILQQNRLRRYGHVLRKEDTDWVKKCMEYEVEPDQEVDQRGHAERLCKKIAKHVI